MLLKATYIEVADDVPLIRLLMSVSFADRQKLSRLRDYLERSEPGYVESNMLESLPTYEHGPHDVSFSFKLPWRVSTDDAELTAAYGTELYRMLEETMARISVPVPGE